MGKHLWISSDATIVFEDRSWITTSIVFNNIFSRVEAFFVPSELACREACYFDWGMDGIELSYVDKECFNIFYLRCKQALIHYPDKEMLAWLERFPDQPEKRDGYINGITFEWEEILKRLELDKRYDAAWIEGYRSKRGEVD
ncbi:hypothetical protein [Collimonas humicola]|uniref:hypothetical protein n=1 Tax=Collimonas humicola TaxID=2825886 RepID=UPI001B8A8EBC|nr:hypothetical protein [Collimonas humicola]